MTTADHILDQIDLALGDTTVGPDAMRSKPEPTAPQPRTVVITCDTRAAHQALERAGRAFADLQRAAATAAPGLEQAAANAAASFRAMRDANDRPTGRRDPSTP